jgi:hypothetical protein
VWSLPIFVPFISYVSLLTSTYNISFCSYVSSTYFYLQRSIYFFYFFTFFYLQRSIYFYLFLMFLYLLLPIFVLFTYFFYFFTFFYLQYCSFQFFSISFISLLSSTYNTVVFNFSQFSFLSLLSSTNNNVVFNFCFLSLSFFMFLLYPSVCMHFLYFLTILLFIFNSLSFLCRYFRKGSNFPGLKCTLDRQIPKQNFSIFRIYFCFRNFLFLDNCILSFKTIYFTQEFTINYILWFLHFFVKSFIKNNEIYYSS